PQGLGVVIHQLARFATVARSCPWPHSLSGQPAVYGGVSPKLSIDCGRARKRVPTRAVMNRTTLRLSRSLLVLPLLWMFLPATAKGGLVIEVDPAIQIRAVSDLAIDRGNLVIKLEAGHRRIIQLPPGALELIAAWAASEADGPMIFSIDQAF